MQPRQMPSGTHATPYMTHISESPLIFINERYKWEDHGGNHIKLQFCPCTNGSICSDIGYITNLELQIAITGEFSVGSYHFLFNLHVK